MSKAALKIISDAMRSLGLNYDFPEWNGSPVYPYFTGEYSEIPSQSENGMQETSFLLTGFARGKDAWLDLEDAKEKISDYFGRIGGQTLITDGGSAVVVLYENALVIPTGNAELKRIEINLTIKEWRVI